MTKTNIKNLTVIAVFGALAFVLMFIGFKIPFLSPFMSLDLSAVIELMGGFVLGPVGGLGIVMLKLVLKLIFQGTETMFTGEIQNFLLDGSLVLISALIYKKRKTKKGAVAGLFAGSLASIVLAVITNIYVIFPFYIKLFGMDWEKMLNMHQSISPLIKDIPTLIVFSILPFNVISRAITSIVTMLLYKKVSNFIKR